MRTIPKLLALALAGALFAPIAHAEEARVTLLHTTDLHGALTGYDYLADRPAARGLTRIATLIKRARADGVPSLLVDAGDCIQGGGIEAMYQHGDRSKSDPMIAAMNAIGYDCMTVGNHEFNFGVEVLRKAEGSARFPFLGANILRDDNGLAAFNTSFVKVVNGVRVGIVGITTPAIPFWEDSTNYAGLHFGSPVYVAQLEVARLRQKERCDVVVILAHTGLERDVQSQPEKASDDTPDENWGYRLAHDVPGVDIVILGHTHVVVPSTEIYGVLVTQAGKWGEDLGRIDLTFSRASAGDSWKLMRRTAQIIAVTDTTREDPEISALAAPWHEETQRWLSRVVGKASRELTSPHGRFAPSAIWELVQRAQLDASGADVSLASLFNPEAKIAAGTVTVRDVVRVYPYDNTLGVVTLTGAELRETLEESAGYFRTYDYAADRPLTAGGRAGFNYDAAYGVNYDIDLTRPPGDRIQNLLFHGQPLAADQMLKVAVNNYRLNGGGGFGAVRRAPRVWRSDREVQDLLADWIGKSGPLDGTFTANWSLVPDYVATVERPLIDRLVREGVAPKEELMRMDSDEAAKRGDVAYWLARAFGWREKRLSGAFADVPDSLEPWLDGLMKRGVLGAAATSEKMEPFKNTDPWTAISWSEASARAAGFAVAPGTDPSFRRSVLTGTSVSRSSLAASGGETLTHAQLLGLVSNARFPTVRVLETTDFHGNILPGARERRSRRPVGSSPVLAAYVKQLRAENPEGTILLDGGDWFQGTMISNLQFGRPVVQQMNMLEYTAAAIGNHDFDWTADTLAQRSAEMHFATLGANCIERKTGRRPRYARADTVVTRRGVRVGILGLCYRETPTVTLAANVAHLRFEDDSATAARLVPDLRKRQRATLVLGVGHVPAETDSTMRALSGDLPRLARGVKGVDAWFGGHSHNLVLDEIGGVPLMIAGSHAEVIGLCDLTMDPVKGRVIEKHSRLVNTFADAIEPDSAMSAEVTRWNSAIAPLAEVPLGRTARRLPRGGDPSIGYLVTDAMRARVGADIALQNSGGLRADLPEGVITRGAVYEVLPFENTIVTVDLTGAEVKQSFEDGLAGNRVPVVGGVKFSYDLDLPSGHRLVSIALVDGTPIDDRRVYKVAANNFMATGGDGYSTLAKGRNLKDTGVSLRDLLESFILAKCANGGQIDYQPEHRATKVGAAAPPPPK